jgi:hypothetical protein
MTHVDLAVELDGIDLGDDGEFVAQAGRLRSTGRRQRREKIRPDDFSYDDVKRHNGHKPWRVKPKTSLHDSGDDAEDALIVGEADVIHSDDNLPPTTSSQPDYAPYPKGMLKAVSYEFNPDAVDHAPGQWQLNKKNMLIQPTHNNFEFFIDGFPSDLWFLSHDTAVAPWFASEHTIIVIQTEAASRLLSFQHVSKAPASENKDPSILKANTGHGKELAELLSKNGWVVAPLFIPDTANDIDLGDSRHISIPTIHMLTVVRIENKLYQLPPGIYPIDYPSNISNIQDLPEGSRELSTFQKEHAVLFIKAEKQAVNAQVRPLLPDEWFAYFPDRKGEGVWIVSKVRIDGEPYPAALSAYLTKRYNAAFIYNPYAKREACTATIRVTDGKHKDDLSGGNHGSRQIDIIAQMLGIQPENIIIETQKADKRTLPVQQPVLPAPVKVLENIAKAASMSEAYNSNVPIPQRFIDNEKSWSVNTINDLAMYIAERFGLWFDIDTFTLRCNSMIKRNAIERDLAALGLAGRITITE